MMASLTICLRGWRVNGHTYLKNSSCCCGGSLHKESYYEVMSGERKQIAAAVGTRMFISTEQIYTVRFLQLSSLGTLGSLKNSYYNEHQDCSQICLKSVIMLLSWVLSVSCLDTVTIPSCVSLTVLSERFQSGTVCAVCLFIWSCPSQRGMRGLVHYVCIVSFICTLLYLNRTVKLHNLSVSVRAARIKLVEHTSNILSKQDATCETWSFYLAPHPGKNNMNCSINHVIFHHLPCKYPFPDLWIILIQWLNRWKTCH